MEGRSIMLRQAPDELINNRRSIMLLDDYYYQQHEEKKLLERTVSFLFGQIKNDASFSFFFI